MAGGSGPPAFEVTVFGKAKPAGSKRAFAYRPKGGGKMKAAVSDANPDSKDWKLQVAQICGEAMAGLELYEKTPLRAEFTFYVMRPKGHSGMKGLRPSAPPYPITRPDLLKLARGIEDAMSKVVYRDDSEIVTEVLNKRYGQPERVEISVGPMP
jgi:Holliday junction resolvase RusA-like endonuclease